jgi:uncharacterized protein (TIGR03437 family)
MSRMTMSRLLVLVFLFVCASGLHAQVSGTRIFTNPPGATFYVDDQFYTNEVTLLWPANSKHFIRVDPSQSGVRFKTLYTFGGATTNLGPAPLVPLAFTANPAINYIQLDFTISYAATLSFFPCPDPQGCAGKSPGKVVMGGAPFYSDGEAYFGAGTSITVEAYPSSGWIFTGWGLMPGVPKGSTFIYSFTLNQPQVIHPLFQSARPIGISLDTQPTGLQLLIDRSPVYAPKSYEWGWGTDHQIGVVPSQRDDHGHWLVFDSWSDGGAINHVYTMQGEFSSPVSLSAKFVPGASVTFLTNPPNLGLTIDGRQNWQSYNFVWRQGSTHTVVAPATQTDEQGRTYRFVSWSNGGGASQQYTVEAAPDDVRLTATYQPVAQVTITSVPPGIAMLVDDTRCSTPCVLQRDVGATLSIGAPSLIPAGEGSRLVFQSWSDTPDATRKLLANTATPVNIEARYQLQHLLTTAADPAGGVQLTVSPGSSDGFYNAQSVVAIGADEKSGFRFLGWSGDGSGVFRPLAVTMNSPKTIVVMLDPVPFIDKGGVKNGVGDTPEPIVAPGSIISVTGVNLAAGEERGPLSPLRQSLAGVTVRSSGLLLPLFYVSPNQINAQLPFEVSEGDQTLTVSVPGKPDITVNFTVARNAPGLFATPLGDTPYATATHADGTAVTIDNPAAKGEIITLQGTGFGPYKGTAPDGFALPPDPSFTLIDAATVVAGDTELPSTYAGAAAQKVGVNAVSFQITDALPTGGDMPVKVRVNGHESNVVILPMK